MFALAGVLVDLLAVALTGNTCVARLHPKLVTIARPVAAYTAVHRAAKVVRHAVTPAVLRVARCSAPSSCMRACRIALAVAILAQRSKAPYVMVAAVLPTKSTLFADLASFCMPMAS